MQNGLKLTYFDRPGTAEVARMCFFLGDVKFTDERLTQQQFEQLKSEGKFKFGQLPVLSVNGSQYAQSGAIDRYAAQISGLYPKDPIEVIKVEQAMHTTQEIKMKFFQTLTIQGEKEQELARSDLCQNFLPLWCQRLGNLIDDNSTGYVSGNSITLGDMDIYNLVQVFSSGVIKELPLDFISSYKTLEAHQKLIGGNKKIQEWQNSHKK